MVVEEGGGLSEAGGPIGIGLSIVCESDGDDNGVNLVCEKLALCKGLASEGAMLPTADCLQPTFTSDSRKPIKESRCTAPGPFSFDNKLARTSP